ncbi:MAG: methylmalonyl Co-A mutase-associated GTPase MeaB [Candidatus Hodarchaeales archaeon]
MEDLVKGVLQGNRRAIARAISLIENNPDQCPDFIKKIYPATGKAFIIGITGAPGSGKSTLVNSLTQEFRKKGKRVGIIAVDPTSPFSGGALLGDRIRMDGLTSDKNIFIRSMGSRGSLGGLSKATIDASRVLDAAGFELIIIETVGAGQSEVDIVRVADCSIVIGIPGTGDAVQAIKAGILEIANIYVVNKSDRPGASEIANELKLLISLDPKAKEKGRWKIPVILTSSYKNTGIEELAATIEKYQKFLEDPVNYQYAWEQEMMKRKHEIHEIIKVEIFENMLTSLVNKQKWEEILRNVIDKKVDPYSAASAILDPLFQ